MSVKLYKLSSREFKKKDTKVSVGNLKIGGRKIIIMAGPCAIESKKQLMDCAKMVKKQEVKYCGEERLNQELPLLVFMD